MPPQHIGAQSVHACAGKCYTMNSENVALTEPQSSCCVPYLQDVCVRLMRVNVPNQRLHL